MNQNSKTILCYCKVKVSSLYNMPRRYTRGSKGIPLPFNLWR